MLGFGFNKDKVRASADKFVQQGKLQNAIAEYDKILKIDPKDLTVLNTVGDLYSRLGQAEQAVECFKKVGDNYASEGFVPKAIAMYKKLTKLTPNAYDCVQKLGELYIQQGLYNDARAQFLLASDGMMKSGQPDGAIKILKRVLEVDPENAGVQAKLADIYLKQGKRDEAKVILLSAAESMYQRNAVDAAAEILSRLLTLDKENSRARLLQGQIMLEKGDAPGAIKALEFLPDIDSRPDALRTMMRALVVTGRLSEAEPIARKMFNVHHDISGIAAVTEKVVVADPIKGLKYYEEFGDKLIAASPTNVVASLRGLVARVKENVNSLEILLKLFQRAGDSSQNAEIYEMIASACVNAGTETDLKRAAQLYKQLALLEPENPLHAQSYRQVLTKLGEDPTVIESPITDSEVPFAGGQDDWSAPPTMTSAEEASERSFDEMTPEERVAATAAAAAHPAAPPAAPPPAAAAPAEFAMDAQPAPQGSAFEVAPEAPVEAPQFNVAEQPSFDVAPAMPSASLTEFNIPEAPAETGGNDFSRITESRSATPPPQPAIPRSDEVHDLSDEWEKHVAEPETPLIDRSRVSDVSMLENSAAEAFAASAQPIPDLVEEIKFYISQQMWHEANAAVEKLGEIAPLHEQLASLRQQVAEGQAPKVAADGSSVSELALDTSVVESGEIIEISSPEAEATFQEIGFDNPEPLPAPPPPPVVAAPPPPPPPPVAAPKPAKPAAPPKPPAPPKAAPAPAAGSDDILGDLVSDLESSLGDDFTLGAPAKPAPATMSAAASAAPTPKAPPAPAPTPAPAPAAPPAVAAHAAGGNGSKDSGLLDDLFDEFKQDLGETTEQSVEDPDTHYNLGVAFKEMGLLDEAIGELQKVCQAIDHKVPFAQPVQAYTWLASCFVEKGVPEASYMWYERALTIAPDTEARAAILYELGAAYESANDREKAKETFTKVMAINIDFRDVGERIKALKT